MPRLTQGLTRQPVGAVGSGLGGAEGAGFEGVAELVEGGEGVAVGGGGGAFGEEVVDAVFEGVGRHAVRFLTGDLGLR